MILKNLEVYSAMVPSTTANIGGVSYVINDAEATKEMMALVEKGQNPGEIVSKLSTQEAIAQDPSTKKGSSSASGSSSSRPSASSGSSSSSSSGSYSSGGSSNSGGSSSGNGGATVSGGNSSDPGNGGSSGASGSGSGNSGFPVLPAVEIPVPRCPILAVVPALEPATPVQAVLVAALAPLSPIRAVAPAALAPPIRTTPAAVPTTPAVILAPAATAVPAVTAVPRAQAKRIKRRVPAANRAPTCAERLSTLFQRRD